MSYNIYAALELGTTRTVLAVAECETGKKLTVTSLASIPSVGVRKSQITDIEQAKQSIRGVIGEIERKAKKEGGSIDIANAFLVVNGQHVSADQLSSTIAVNNKTVSDEDIENVVANAHQLTPGGGERVGLDIIEQDFCVDQRGGILSPKNIAGHVLKLNVLSISADKNRIEDARTAADAAHLELRDPLFACTCAAEAVLQDHEKKNGVLVLDLGGGSTGYAVYSDGYLVATGAIGVGGDHITNDLAQAFQLSNARAEMLKREHASAVVSSLDEDDRITIDPSTPGMDSRSVPCRAVNIVTNARVKEIIAMIREKLEEQDLINRLHSGIVITGGGAKLKEIDLLLQREIGTTVRIGKPLYIDGLDQEEFPAEFAAIAGALLYAHKNYEERSLFDTLKGIFR
ncbi:MAG: cell division protein FtsA [Kiritimatiellae bacterium]|nr:cell division protein FtsA [Kiritimatiellia bacterium]